MRTAGFVLFLMLFAAAAPAQSDKTNPSDAPPASGEGNKEELVERTTDRSVDVPPVHAKEDCRNWAWAAAVEAVLYSDGVEEFRQDYWMDKLYGGTVCLDSAGEIETLIKAVEGEYVLDNGKHVVVTATYTRGLPANASEILVPLMHQRLQIALLGGKAMLFTGARWEDITKLHGDQTVRVRELRFTDLTKPAGQSTVILDPEKDDLSQVDGIFRINVAVIETHQ